MSRREFSLRKRYRAKKKDIYLHDFVVNRKNIKYLLGKCTFLLQGRTKELKKLARNIK